MITTRSRSCSDNSPITGSRCLSNPAPRQRSRVHRLARRHARQSLLRHRRRHCSRHSNRPGLPTPRHEPSQHQVPCHPGDRPQHNPLPHRVRTDRDSRSFFGTKIVLTSVVSKPFTRFFSQGHGLTVVPSGLRTGSHTPGERATGNFFAMSSFRSMPQPGASLTCM